MPKERRSFSGAEKMAILREHLIERVPISEVREKHGIHRLRELGGRLPGRDCGCLSGENHCHGRMPSRLMTLGLGGG